MVQQAIPLSVIETRLREIDTMVQRLTMEREVLTTLRSRAEEMESTGRTGPLVFDPTADNRGPLTDTLAAFVRKFPGHASAEIVDAITASGFTVGGSDARKTIQTTLGALMTRMRISRDEEGRYFPIV